MIKACRPYLVLVASTVMLGCTAGLVLAQSRIANPVARLAALNLQEQTITRDLAKSRTSLSRLMMALTLFRRDPPPALLVSPNDARDAVRAAILIRAITPDIKARADRLVTQNMQVATLRREAAAANAEIFSAESHAANLRGPGDPTADDALGPLVDATPSVAVAVEGPLKLVRPVSGVIIRRFGQDTAGGRSRGLTIRAENQAVVLSPATGVVEYAGEVSGWGVVVILKASGPYHVVVGGLGDTGLRAGQRLQAGDRLGHLPDRDESKPDLYLELRSEEAPIDPSRWLPN
jgi:septal ring factor EnvC (AmiA/AmiB activator)